MRQIGDSQAEKYGEFQTSAGMKKPRSEILADDHALACGLEYQMPIEAVCC
jgi:hypothetical protein